MSSSGGKQQRLRTLERKVRRAGLPLQENSTHLVFGKGNPDARLLFIGEAPGKQEDLQGVPFVGAAGRELDGLLHAVGLSLDDVYITNILKYRPPNNRDPEPGEIRAHTPYLIEQIRIIRPKVVATLGNFATKFMLGGLDAGGMTSVPGMGRIHGRHRQIEFEGAPLSILPLYHPAAMLYNPGLRKVLRADFRKLRDLLG